MAIFSKADPAVKRQRDLEAALKDTRLVGEVPRSAFP
jgi:hypothetical protein